MAIANREDLTDTIDKNNELLLCVGYLSLYRSTLIDTELRANKMRSMILGIIFVGTSFAITSIIHGFELRNVYLFVFILLIIGITVKNNSFLPKQAIEPVLYCLYKILFISIAIDIFSSHKAIVGWLFY